MLYLYMPKHFTTWYAILLLFQGQATPDVPTIMEALFQCTLEMLNKDLEEFPEHRLLFFRMLQSFTTHCFPGIIIIVYVYRVELFLYVGTHYYKGQAAGASERIYVQWLHFSLSKNLKNLNTKLSTEQELHL